MVSKLLVKLNSSEETGSADLGPSRLPNSVRHPARSAVSTLTHLSRIHEVLEVVHGRGLRV